MTENKKYEIRLPLIIAAMLALGMFVGQKLPHYDRQARLSVGSGEGSGTLDEVLRYVESKYVDSVNVTDLRRDAIDHLLSKLDPHSVYITPDELDAVNDDMSGDFEGIGVEFLMVDDTMQVVTPLSGGPAEGAGVLAGDKIITVNDTSISGQKIDNGVIYKRLRGKKGSTVKVGILRGKETSLRFFNLTRAVIPVHSVDIAYMLDEHTGYLKINRFTEHTYQEFMENLRPLSEQKGLQNLIIDLRGNPGGFLDQATDVLSQLFPEGKLLVYTEGRTEHRKDYKSNGRARFNINNVCVLIDEGSASASEIVAGAIQDWDRGWIVGRRSYGKGLVQEQFPLGNGGALRLTVARYYTPSGRCIQRDYKHDKDYEHEAERRLKDGELVNGNKGPLPDSTKYYTGMGRIVYGGGGITPDVFIPFDTILTNAYFQAVRQVVPQFAARWIEARDRNTLPADADTFASSWFASDAMLDELLQYADKEGVKAAPTQLASCRNELKLQLKARISRALFGDIGLYKVANDDDPAVEKALQLMKSGQPVTKK